MCRVLKVARAGFYDWLNKPLSDRAIENKRLQAENICSNQFPLYAQFGFSFDSS